MSHPENPPPAEPTKLKLDPNLASALAYLFGCLSGILFFVLETENKRVRFHALQSILLFSSLSLLQIGAIFMAVFTDVGIFSALQGILAVVYFVAWLIMVIRTYQGHDIKLPVVGDVAQKQVGWP